MINISVMGSVGKSTTAHALAWYLSNFGNSYFCGLGNYPKHITAAIKRAKAKKPAYSVFEVSGATFMKGTRETIGERSNAAISPEVLLFTAIAPAHYAWCGSLSELARRKSQGFKKIKKGGVLVLNANSPELETLKNGLVEGVMLLTYGISVSCDVFFDAKLSQVAFRELRFEVKFPPFFSLFEKLNIVGCIAAVFALVPLVKLPAVFDFSKLPILDGRGKFYKDIQLLDRKVNIISDCYNSNPHSMLNGLHKFSRVKTPGRRVVVICQMKDLGSIDLAAHQAVLNKAVSLGFDLVIAVGEKYRGEYQNFVNCTLEELNDVLNHHLAEGDTLYFKGSHMYGLWAFVNTVVGNKSNLKIKFYEQRPVLNAL